MFLTKYCIFAVILVCSVNSSPLPDTIFEEKSELDTKIYITPKPGIVFEVPEGLCGEIDETISEKCEEYCKSKGYGTGLCFNKSCTCN